MRGLYVNIIVIFIILFSIIAFLESELDYNEINLIETGYISENCEINYNDFGIPFIKTDVEKDNAFLMGFTHAKDRLLQIDYLISFAKGKLTERYNKKYNDIDYITRRLNLETFSKSEYDKLPATHKELLKLYVSGINCYLKNLEDFSIGVFSIEPLEWEPYYPLLVKNFLLLSKSNQLKELFDFYDILSIESADLHIKKELIRLLGIESIGQIYKGLDGEYLRLLKIYFDELPKLLSKDISFEVEDENIGFSFYSQKGNLVKNLESYLCIVNYEPFLNIPGVYEALNKSDLIKTNLDLNIKNIYKDGDSFYFQDSLVNSRFELDTINNNITYLISSEGLNIINYNKKERLLSINVDGILIDSTFTYSNNSNTSKRIDSLLNSIVKYRDTEFQLISNDKYSPFFNRFVNFSLPILLNFQKNLSVDELSTLEKLKTWEYQSDLNDELAILTYKWIDNLIRILFEERLNINTDFLKNKKDLTERILLKALTESQNIWDDKFTNETETRELAILNSFKSSSKSLGVKHSFTTSSLEEKLLDKKLSFFNNNLLEEGSINSIRSVCSLDSNIFYGSAATLIFNKKSNDLYFQSFSGQSGNKLSKNYSDLHRLWSTGGFIKVNTLDSDNYTKKIRFTKK